MVLGLQLHPRSLSLQMSTVAGFGTGHCSPGLDMERRWCGMGGSGTGTSSAQPRRIVLGGAWRATARGRTLGRRRFGTEALARAAHAAAPLRGLTARAVAAACTPATRALRTGPVCGRATAAGLRYARRRQHGILCGHSPRSAHEGHTLRECRDYPGRQDFSEADQGSRFESMANEEPRPAITPRRKWW